MGIANGGEVIVSDLVRELVAGHDYLFSGRGLRDLKGFGEPVRVSALDWRHEGPISAAATAAEVLESYVGMDPGPGEWVEVTPDSIGAFQMATSDDSAADGAIPPMMLVSLLTHLVDSVPVERPAEGLLMGINYGFEEVRFFDSVVVGCRLRARSVPESVVQRGTSVNVTSRVTIDVEDRSHPALEALWVTRGVYSG